MNRSKKWRFAGALVCGGLAVASACAGTYWRYEAWKSFKAGLEISATNYGRMLQIVNQDADQLHVDVGNFNLAVQQGDAGASDAEQAIVDQDRQVLWKHIALFNETAQTFCKIVSDPQSQKLASKTKIEDAQDAACNLAPQIVDLLKEQYFLTSAGAKLAL